MQTNCRAAWSHPKHHGHGSIATDGERLRQCHNLRKVDCPNPLSTLPASTAVPRTEAAVTVDSESLDRAVPAHVAIIMDGNGRWAQARGMSRAAGHREGVKAARAAIEACLEFGIRYLTLFAFSTENWNRPAREIGDLWKLFRAQFDSVGTDIPEGVRVRFVGERDRLDAELRRLMRKAESRPAAEPERLLVSVAINYGGRHEITTAARRLAEKAASGELLPSDIDEATFAGELMAGGVPDPDLVIRTAGEQRISNFLLWQTAYAEFVSMECLWPEFDQAAMRTALATYAQRERRFGTSSDA